MGHVGISSVPEIHKLGDEMPLLSASYPGCVTWYLCLSQPVASVKEGESLITDL